MTPTWLRAWNLTVSLAFAFLAIACQSPHPEKVTIPQEVLPPDSMVAVLTDIHIVEGAKVGRNIIGNDSLEVSDFYDKVFAKHEVSKERFEESFAFYTKHPHHMQEIYEEVIENLNKIDLYPKREKIEDGDGEGEISKEEKDATASDPPPAD